jgi:hypothetical protein
MLTFLFTLATGAGTGAALGVRWQRMVLCSPSCQKDGVWLWTPEQEEAAWKRGVTIGRAYSRGELAGSRLEERVWRLLAQRRERIEEPDDEPARTVAA